MGYSLLYLNDVVRPGKQIDRVIKLGRSSQAILFTPAVGLVGPARPGFAFNSSEFWAQGINLGLEFQF